MAIDDEPVVDGLHLGGMEPDRDADAGLATDSRSVPEITSRSANAIGSVSKTTAYGGPAGERTRPR